MQWMWIRGGTVIAAEGLDIWWETIEIRDFQDREGKWNTGIIQIINNKV